MGYSEDRRTREDIKHKLLLYRFLRIKKTFLWKKHTYKKHKAEFSTVNSQNIEKKTKLVN